MLSIRKLSVITFERREYYLNVKDYCHKAIVLCAAGRRSATLKCGSPTNTQPQISTCCRPKTHHGSILSRGFGEGPSYRSAVPAKKPLPPLLQSEVPADRVAANPSRVNQNFPAWSADVSQYFLFSLNGF